MTTTENNLSQAERDRLVASVEALIWKQTVTYCRRGKMTSPDRLDDCLQYVRAAVVRAAQLYNPGQIPWVIYAATWMRSGLSDFRNEHTPKGYRKKRYGDRPFVISDSDPRVLLSSDSREEIRDTPASVLSDEKASCDVEDIDNADEVAHCLQFVRPADRQILEWYFLNGETCKQIGKRLNICRQAANLRVKKAIAKIRSRVRV